MTIDVHFAIGERHFDVLSCRVVEGASELTTAEVLVTTPDLPDFEGAVTRPATLEIDAGVRGARRWTLVLGSAELVDAPVRAALWRLELHEPLWLLGLTRTTRKFRNQTTRAIVTHVLAEIGVESEWRLVRPTRQRSYTAQYRESSLAFALRLLEGEGIFHTVDESGCVVLEDDSTWAPAAPGPPVFDLQEAAGSLARGEGAIHAFKRRATVSSGRASVADHDWKKPQVPLYRSAAAARDGELEVYDYPSGYRDPDEGERLARLRLEAYRALASTVEGRSDVIGFAPVRRFCFGDRAGPVFAGEYVLLHVEHVANTPAASQPDHARIVTDWMGGAAPAAGGELPAYENEFRAIPRAVPFRPALATARPRVAGSHTAMVRGPGASEIHTDAHGRFKAQFHWDREATGTDDDSRWVRMLQESATSMSLARVGWEVGVVYIDGDPDRPVGIARQINGVMPPAYAQPSSKTRMTVKTPASPATGGFNELRLEDSLGSMSFDVRAERDLMGIVKNDRSETIGNDESHVVGQSLVRNVNHDLTVTIGADSTTTVNADHALTVGVDRDKTVGGSERFEVGGAAMSATRGSETETVGGSRVTVAGSVGAPSLRSMAKGLVPQPRALLQSVSTGAAVGALGGGGFAGAGAGAASSMKSLLPSPPSAGAIVASMMHGSIRRTAQRSVTRTVGGAFVSVAAGPISTSTMLGYAETVGGVKITIAGGGISERVGGVLATTVGGLIVRAAGGDLVRSSKVSRITVGGVASFTTPVAATIRAGTVRISALAGLTLKSGALELELAPGALSIKGDMKIESSGSIVVRGAKENLTPG